MKLVPIIASMILASAMLGYGFAQAQSFGTPTTASHPNIPICGDHPCKPGEVYTPGGGASATATASANATAKTGTNGTSGTMSAQLNISANATVTKTNGKMTNATMANATGAMSTSMGMSENVTATKIPANMTAKGNMTTTVKPAPKMESPAKQVASGTASADVKCPTGYQLALNKFDNRPACVTADIYAKLVARGWAS